MVLLLSHMMRWNAVDNGNGLVLVCCTLHNTLHWMYGLTCLLTYLLSYFYVWMHIEHCIFIHINVLFSSTYCEVGWWGWWLRICGINLFKPHSLNAAGACVCAERANVHVCLWNSQLDISVCKYMHDTSSSYLPTCMHVRHSSILFRVCVCMCDMWVWASGWASHTCSLSDYLPCMCITI